MMRQLVQEREWNFDFLVGHWHVVENNEDHILAIRGKPFRHCGSEMTG